MRAMFYDIATSRADRTAAHIVQQGIGARTVPTALMQQFLIPKFLSPETCAALIERIDQTVRPSTITDDIGDPEFRTSWTGDLDHDDPIVADLDARLCALTGIDAAMKSVNSSRGIPTISSRPASIMTSTLMFRASARGR